MLKAIKRLLWVGALLVAAFAAWFIAFAWSDLPIKPPTQFSIKQGSSLRSAAHQMEDAGVLDSPWRFEMLARIVGDASRVQAGNYELIGSLTPFALLGILTSRGHSQDKLTLIDGWTFSQLRAALDAHPAVRHDTHGIPESEIVSRLGISSASAEGWFFPDTYFFVNNTSDVELMNRAYRAMRSQLDTLWAARAQGLPLASPYEALILASIVEKETGQAAERSLIAAVFLNRIKSGMKLQTDPTVIYGMGAKFDGNLRKRDLLTDGDYNTYTRQGLPPTPIALPGLASLAATLNPASSKALYFVAQGDGTSHFSNTLAEHERAVTKYQRRGGR